MRNKLLYIMLWVMFCAAASGQDTAVVVIDSIALQDEGELVVGDNIITNTSALKLFFEKLYYLDTQKAGKVNIVHIGDSHIQADLFTGVIRKTLQERFGNGGCGFTFPHNLAKTNGGHYVRYNSNVSWNSRRNIHEPSGTIVGLSGIGLYTEKDFAVEVNVRDSAYDFNTIKIITPGNKPMFDVATSKKTIVLESTVPKKITHRIKSGEVLGSIADKYGVGVTAIKRLNGLKSDNIRAGKTLRIPTNEMEAKQVKRSEFIPLKLTADDVCNYYHSDEPLSKIYLLPGQKSTSYNLNGLVFEKDDAGLIYHSIGVNGAKASDYNKYPLFFEQLPALKPDLIVVSLGTNESFDKMSNEDYMAQLNQFLANIKVKNPEAAILIMTPPPSLFKRRYPNTFAAGYAKNILMQEIEKNYASWDLYSELGGLFSVNRNSAKGLVSADKVHYSKAGYEKQGEMFSEAFMKAYDNFITNRK
jgi:LysM repeat protein/lysophospholipase L1-like esterase